MSGFQVYSQATDLPFDILNAPSTGADRSAWGTVLPGHHAVSRGFLRQNPRTQNWPNAQYNFLYNPNDISSSISFDTNTVIPQPNEPPNVSGSQTIQIPLYIDRQTGVNIDAYRGLGAMYDVQYIERLLGMNTFNDNMGGGVSSAADVLHATYISSPMVSFVFSSYLQINGVVTGFTTQFTKFTSGMVPTIATVTFTLVVFYAGTQTSSDIAPPTDPGSSGVADNGGIPDLGQYPVPPKQAPGALPPDNGKSYYNSLFPR